MLKIFKEILTNTGPKIFFHRKKKIKNYLSNNLDFKSFGSHNKYKNFYIIRRHPWAGFFSNITFILNHLHFCELMNFIPIIDMKNFPTIYNEKTKVKNSINILLQKFIKVKMFFLVN